MTEFYRFTFCVFCFLCFLSIFFFAQGFGCTFAQTRFLWLIYNVHSCVMQNMYCVAVLCVGCALNNKYLCVGCSCRLGFCTCCMTVQLRRYCKWICLNCALKDCALTSGFIWVHYISYFVGKFFFLLARFFFVCTTKEILGATIVLSV